MEPIFLSIRKVMGLKKKNVFMSFSSRCLSLATLWNEIVRLA